MRQNGSNCERCIKKQRICQRRHPHRRSPAVHSELQSLVAIVPENEGALIRELAPVEDFLRAEESQPSFNRASQGETQSQTLELSNAVDYFSTLFELDLSYLFALTKTAIPVPDDNEVLSLQPNNLLLIESGTCESSVVPSEPWNESLFSLEN